MNSVRGRPLVEIETWIFDLDNTLYPSSCRLFDQIHARMTGFIADRLGVSPEAALTDTEALLQELSSRKLIVPAETQADGSAH